MKTSVSLLAIIVLATCFLGNEPVKAQGIKKWLPADIVAKARPGQWVELEGTVGKDSTVTTLEIKFLTGDFMDDDWEFLATVTAINPAENTFSLMMLPVRITKDTEFDQNLDNLQQIEPGMLIEIEGTYLQEGVFLAIEVDKKNKKNNGNLQSEKIIEAIGKIEHVDIEKQIISIMGIRFHITEETEGKSPIK